MHNPGIFWEKNVQIYKNKESVGMGIYSCPFYLGSMYEAKSWVKEFRYCNPGNIETFMTQELYWNSFTIILFKS